MFFLESIRFGALKYFTKHACPKTFSLTSVDAKQNNFYEIRVFVPHEQNPEEILYSFVPSKEKQPRVNLLKGTKFSDSAPPANCYISPATLANSKINVKYYLGTWVCEEQDCNELQLVKLVLWKYLGLMRIDVLISKLTRYFRNWRISKRLRSPLKSKFEIYERLMSSEKFLDTGTFSRNDVIDLFLDSKSFTDFRVRQRFTNSLNWIFEACVEDGEIVQIGTNTFNPLYKMKGKGIHYFTLTKEQIKNEEHNKKIQKSQTKIQNGMLICTALLVVVTAITAFDKYDEVFRALSPLIDKLAAMLTIP